MFPFVIYQISFVFLAFLNIEDLNIHKLQKLLSINVAFVLYLEVSFKFPYFSSMFFQSAFPTVQRVDRGKKKRSYFDRWILHLC